MNVARADVISGDLYVGWNSGVLASRLLPLAIYVALLWHHVEGGSHAAQSSFILALYLEELDAAKIIYKYSKISVQRQGCDCNALFQNPPWLSLNRSTNLCYWRLCSPMRDAEEKLNPTQIREIEDEISVYEPSPKPCDVEILKE